MESSKEFLRSVEIVLYQPENLTAELQEYIENLANSNNMVFEKNSEMEHPVILTVREKEHSQSESKLQQTILDDERVQELGLEEFKPAMTGDNFYLFYWEE